MKIQTNNNIAAWQETLGQLSWTPKDALHSASLALSKAGWLGIEKDQAIQKVLEAADSVLLMENPYVLLETWQAISEQMANPEDLLCAYVELPAFSCN
jgi:hypothetical protein